VTAGLGISTVRVTVVSSVAVWKAGRRASPWSQQSSCPRFNGHCWPLRPTAEGEKRTLPSASSSALRTEVFISSLCGASSQERYVSQLGAPRTSQFQNAWLKHRNPTLVLIKCTISCDSDI